MLHYLTAAARRAGRRITRAVLAGAVDTLTELSREHLAASHDLAQGSLDQHAELGRGYLAASGDLAQGSLDAHARVSHEAITARLSLDRQNILALHDVARRIEDATRPPGVPGL